MSETSLGVWFPAVRCGSGTDMFTERLATALSQRGIRAEITWLSQRAEYAPWSVAIPKPPSWANIVHVNTWLPIRFVPKKLLVVATIHSCIHDPTLLPFKSSLKELYHRVWIYRVESAILTRAQKVVAVSQYAAAQARATFSHHGITVIHNGIDCTRFKSISRRESHHPFRLLYVGNWSALKGVSLLGPIMERLGQDFELRYTADRNGRHKRYRLPNNCICLGRLHGIEQVVAAYHTADALLFPSHLEGLPLAVLEAMACDLPVIAARVSSLPEVIEHGVTGWLCEHHDQNKFVEACRALAQDSTQWRAMSEATSVRARQYWDEAVMVDRYLECYRSLLMENRY